MENNEIKENNEIENVSTTEEQQPLPKHDPAAEAKGKIIFIVVAITIMVAVKFIFKL